MSHKNKDDKKRYMNAYYQKRFREKAKKQGICVRCYKKPNDGETFFCSECREIMKQKTKEYTLKLRNEVYAAYGGKCACCGESNPLFLTIDHVNGGGIKHRKQLNSKGRNSVNRNFYLLVRNEGYPSDYQLLCFNCNMGRARNNGICPHKTQTN